MYVVGWAGVEGRMNVYDAIRTSITARPCPSSHTDLMLRTKPTAPSSHQSAWTPVSKGPESAHWEALAGCKCAHRFRIYVLNIYQAVFVRVCV